VGPLGATPGGSGQAPIPITLYDVPPKYLIPLNIEGIFVLPFCSLPIPLLVDPPDRLPPHLVVLVPPYEQIKLLITLYY
jgi:hypothetical protein